MTSPSEAQLLEKLEQLSQQSVAAERRAMVAERDLRRVMHLHATAEKALAESREREQALIDEISDLKRLVISACSPRMYGEQDD